MEECEYAPIQTRDSEVEECEDKIPKIYYFRQLFVSSGAWSVFFMVGMYVGAPAVFIPQLRREANSTEAVSVEMASWLTSTSSYGSVIWECLLPVSLYHFGRKTTAIIVNTSTIVVTTVFYCSKTTTHLLIFELLAGFPYAGILTTLIVVIAEYSSPENRGVFLLVKAASVLWGIWISNVIGTYSHWRNIPLLAFACSIYSLTVFFWPESPFWLATKGRFEECRKSHRWLKGTGKKSEEELSKMIISQTNQDVTVENRFIRLFKTLLSKYFYKPVIIGCLPIVLYQFSGKQVFNIYAIEVIKKISNNESAAYTGLLIIDGATVFSMYFSSIISRYVTRRFLLLSSSTIAIFFLFILSLYLYLVKLSILNEGVYVSISILTLFSIFIGIGPAALSIALYGELIPLKHKSLAVVVISMVMSLTQAVNLKCAPYMFRSIGIHGTALFYSITSSILIMLLYKYLPETKEKTLQEVEAYFNKDLEESNSLVESKI